MKKWFANLWASITAFFGKKSSEPTAPDTPETPETPDPSDIADEWDTVANFVCPLSPPEAKNRENCKWKYDKDGHGGNNKSRLVIRLPTAFTRQYNLRDKASCWIDLTSAVKGVVYSVRIPWYKTDNEDKNERASFEDLWNPASAPAKIKVRVRKVVNGVVSVVGGWIETKTSSASHDFRLPKLMGDES